jgi:hypothetical protein
MRQTRRDDPALDLIEHARAVLRGTATLTPQTRLELINAIGIKPSPGATDRVIARAFLAARSARP